MRKITFDIETKNIFADVGTNNPADLDLSVVCIHDSETDEYTAYMEEDLPKLWPIIEKADMLIGYNSDHFDVPLLDKYYPGDLFSIKSLDILKEIKNSFGRRMKLDQVAEGTLGVKKSGHGLEAIAWWKAGEIDKIKKYCIDDVRITKDVYDYALQNGTLKFMEGGRTNEFPLDTSAWEDLEDNALTHTLPF
ncbi:MAG: ribonuclease H-like domain-containing protein [Candidatus Paceibacterota bacterium]